MSAARPPVGQPPSPTPVGGERRQAGYLLGRPTRMSLNEFARSAGLHPDLARRFVVLGLVEASRDATGNLWFTPAQLVKVARVRRLRAGLSLNYAAIGLVIDLLDRIDELEAALRRAGQAGGAVPAGRTRVRPTAPRGRE